MTNITITSAQLDAAQITETSHDAISAGCPLRLAPEMLEQVAYWSGNYTHCRDLTQRETELLEQLGWQYDVELQQRIAYEKELAKLVKEGCPVDLSNSDEPRTAYEQYSQRLEFSKQSKMVDVEMLDGRHMPDLVEAMGDFPYTVGANVTRFAMTAGVNPMSAKTLGSIKSDIAGIIERGIREKTYPLAFRVGFPSAGDGFGFVGVYDEGGKLIEFLKPTAEDRSNMLFKAGDKFIHA